MYLKSVLIVVKAVYLTEYTLNILINNRILMGNLFFDIKSEMQNLLNHESDRPNALTIMLFL